MALLGFSVLLFFGKIPKEEYPVIASIFALLYLLFSLPVFYLHITYYIQNKNLKITFFHHKKTFSVMKDGRTSEYTYSDIILSEKNLNIYHKNKIDKKTRRKTSLLEYNYIKFRLEDGTLLFITSLMTDVLDFDFECNETHYRIFPILLKKDWETIDYSNLKHDKK
jgi:hypothetical protein